MGSRIHITDPTTSLVDILRSSKMAEINWEEINSKLPYQRNDEEKAKRRELFNCKQAVNRSFHFAKNKSQGDSKFGDDLLEFREFRLFLQTLRQFFEYYQAFERIDTGDDNRVSKEEFTSDKIKDALEKWVGPIEDLEAEFDVIDTNSGGQILFTEFVDWALEKNLDIEDDEDEAPTANLEPAE